MSSRPFFPFLRWIGLTLLLASGPSAFAGTLVRIATPGGNLDLELFDQEKPITVQNFLTYTKRGFYQASFSHRLVPQFVLQGGGFYLSANYTVEPTRYTVEPVPEAAPIRNEFTANPIFSNAKGTIAMAKVSGNPDSATSQWFINLRDNNTGTADTGNLDLANGGFTVFGRIVSGADVLQLFNDEFAYATQTSTGPAVYDASGTLNDGNFQEMPLLRNDVATDTLIFTTVTILSEEKPEFRFAKAKVVTKALSVSLRGSCSAGVGAVEYRVGPKGKIRSVAVSRTWRAKITGLKRGRTTVYARAVTQSGGLGTFKRAIIMRR